MLPARSRRSVRARGDAFATYPALVGSDPSPAEPTRARREHVARAPAGRARGRAGRPVTHAQLPWVRRAGADVARRAPPRRSSSRSACRAGGLVGSWSSPGETGFARIDVLGPAAGARVRAGRADDDGERAPARPGSLRVLRAHRRRPRPRVGGDRSAGRMLRSPTVFEDILKTICTTNCAWSATVRMVNGLVAGLGDAGRRRSGPLDQRLPHPGAVAAASSKVLPRRRAGRLPRSVHDRAGPTSRYAGEVDLEAMGVRRPPRSCPTTNWNAACSTCPGVGPYAAAHVMMTLGRNSRLILDSLDPPEVRAAHAQDEARARRHDHPSVPPLRRARGARVLVVPDPRLDRGLRPPRSVACDGERAPHTDASLGRPTDRCTCPYASSRAARRGSSRPCDRNVARCGRAWWRSPQHGSGLRRRPGPEPHHRLAGAPPGPARPDPGRRRHARHDLRRARSSPRNRIHAGLFHVSLGRGGVLRDNVTVAFVTTLHRRRLARGAGEARRRSLRRPVDLAGRSCSSSRSLEEPSDRSSSSRSRSVCPWSRSAEAGTSMRSEPRWSRRSATRPRCRPCSSRRSSSETTGHRSSPRPSASPRLRGASVVAARSDRPDVRRIMVQMIGRHRPHPAARHRRRGSARAVPTRAGPHRGDPDPDPALRLPVGGARAASSPHACPPSSSSDSSDRPCGPTPSPGSMRRSSPCSRSRPSSSWGRARPCSPS